MKNRAVTLLLCLMLAALFRFCAPFRPRRKASPRQRRLIFDLPCAAAILIDEDSGTVLYEKERR